MINVTGAPQELIAAMKAAGKRRGYVITAAEGLEVSDSFFEPLRDFVKNSPDYRGHEGMFVEIDEEMDLIYFALVHNSHRGAAQGGTRYLSYKTVMDLITDGLRLSEGMTYKNALAHLWWGGGKGIIDDPKGIGSRAPEERAKLMARYGRFVASLNGCYVTAEDMNTNTEDMRIIHANCRHCTCIPMDIGGSGNPSPFTARGIINAMKAAVHFLYGKDAELNGRTIAVMGAGNVGHPLITNLIKMGAKVTVAEMNTAAREKLRGEFGSAVTVLEPEGDYTAKIVGADCEILAPCAVGAILNTETIPLIKAKIIAGAANNQLKNPVADSEELHKRGILFLPDYVINRMGITNCANEMYGYVLEDIEKAVEQVYPDTLHILERAGTEDITPFAYADVWAKEEAMVSHPIWGHRGMRIIKQLKENNWANGKSF